MVPPRDVEKFIADLQRRRHGRSDRGATLDDLREIDALIAECPGVSDLWMLRGDYIQICNSVDGGPPLSEALRSYEMAQDIDPDRIDLQLALGYFLDAVNDDPIGALAHFERAVALGGGREALDAVESVKRQME